MEKRQKRHRMKSQNLNHHRIKNLINRSQKDRFGSVILQYVTIYLLQLDPAQQETDDERATGRIDKVQKLSRSKAEWNFLDI